MPLPKYIVRLTDAARVGRNAITRVRMAYLFLVREMRVRGAYP